MDVGGRQIGLCRGTPDHDGSRGAGFPLDLLDVFHELLGQIHLGLAFLHVSAVKLLDVGPD